MRGIPQEDGRLPYIAPGPGGCWILTRAPSGSGYVQVSEKGLDRGAMVHRLFWETFNGAVPEGLELHHVCRVPCCGNPAHLEPVTKSENCRWPRRRTSNRYTRKRSTRSGMPERQNHD